MVGIGVDVAIFVFDEVDEGLGAADVAEFRAVDDFIFAVGFFVFTALEAFVSFFDDEAGGFLHEHCFNGGGESIGIADTEGGVVFVEEEKLDGDVVFHFVDFVRPMKNIEGIFGAAIFAVVHIVVIGAGGVGGVGALGEVDGLVVIGVVRFGDFSLGGFGLSLSGLGGENVGVSLGFVCGW